MGSVDRQFSDTRLAALYDTFCAWERRRDFDFYLPLVMSAGAVLDVGCGTGALLHGARDAGHTGRLCGLDPADGMLRRARRRSDVEWVLGDLDAVAWDQEFDLVVMTGHAFQVLLEDDEIRTSLARLRSALVRGGRFAFETRNPLVREWESWTPENAIEVVDASGATVRMLHEVEAIEGQFVSFSTTFVSSAWEKPQVSRSRLRFLDAASLSEFLSEAGLAIEEQFGDWDERPPTDGSPELITISRRRSASIWYTSPMATPDELAQAYAAAWTERDAVRRRELLDSCCEPDVRFLQEGSEHEVVGIDALYDTINEFQAGWPDGVDVRVEITTPIDAHHGFGRGGFVWIFGEDRGYGTDFVELGANGKMKTIVVFGDPGPPPQIAA
jgi:ubiquinone/menaquinone biosynthesis C-methylase UbiE